jgi:hypothetical protein
MPWRHMREWRYSSTILDLGSRWRWVVSSTTPPLYPRRKRPRCPLDRRLGGPQSRSGRCGVEKDLFPLPRIEKRPSSPSLYRLSYPGSSHYPFLPHYYRMDRGWNPICLATSMVWRSKMLYERGALVAGEQVTEVGPICRKTWPTVIHLTY